MQALVAQLLNKFTITVKHDKELPFLNKYGLINKSGQTILKPLYHAIWELNDFLIGYRFGSRFGIISKSGKIIVDPILKGDIYYSEGKRKKDGFYFAEEFFTKEWNNGDYLTFSIDIGLKKIFIRKTGEIISNGQFGIICEPTPEGFCLVSNNDNWGLFDIRKKALVIDTIFPHGYLSHNQKWDRVKDAAAVLAITLLLGGKKYRLNGQKKVFEPIAKRK